MDGKEVCVSLDAAKTAQTWLDEMIAEAKSAGKKVVTSQTHTASDENFVARPARLGLGANVQLLPRAAGGILFQTDRVLNKITGARNTAERISLVLRNQQKKVGRVRRPAPVSEDSASSSDEDERKSSRFSGNKRAPPPPASSTAAAPPAKVAKR
eukprot:gnl/Spiro4/5096_TR2544_c0_g1_i1.p1 gnl/Spiro4/5096_TR2544_c0_g1~~gnl/Spiro4/5096_TR2544_c0_g1_i1.p1  ORF type:complete len:155 (+),score=41.54 gnl/Spiro4/5096_TR2544_c0_g1_i1:87-551(+)